LFHRKNSKPNVQLYFFEKAKRNIDEVNSEGSVILSFSKLKLLNVKEAFE
jgi:hypothetical protein